MAEISIGRQIYMNRRLNGLTQKQLGEKLGVSERTVSMWESGKSYPDIRTLPDIARFFGTSVDALLGVQSEDDDEKELESAEREAFGIDEEERGDDALFDKATALAEKLGTFNTSHLQRHLGIGYGKAAGFIDKMFSLGLISEPEGVPCVRRWLKK